MYIILLVYLQNLGRVNRALPAFDSSLRTGSAARRRMPTSSLRLPERRDVTRYHGDLLQDGCLAEAHSRSSNAHWLPHRG